MAAARVTLVLQRADSLPRYPGAERRPGSGYYHGEESLRGLVENWANDLASGFTLGCRQSIALPLPRAYFRPSTGYCHGEELLRGLVENRASESTVVKLSPFLQQCIKNWSTDMATQCVLIQSRIEHGRITRRALTAKGAPSRVRRHKYAIMGAPPRVRHHGTPEDQLPGIVYHLAHRPCI